MGRAVYFLGGSCFVAYALLIVYFPHAFTYRVGSVLCAFFFSLAMLGEARRFNPVSDSSLLKRMSGFLSGAFPLLLLLGITSYSLPALHEKLYSSEPEAHSVYRGAFTIAGLFPQSDNHSYFSSILLFLREGKVNGHGEIRPLGHLYSAFLYRLCGDDWIRFFRLSTWVLVFSLWHHGLVLSRLLGRFVGLFSVWTLCVYFPFFQGTFLTELPGGTMGVVGLTLLISGLLRASIWAYVGGLCLFVIAMQMRSGLVLFLPVLVAAGALCFRLRFRGILASFAVCSMILLSFFLLHIIQLRLFRKTITQTGSHAIQFYQVLKNSDSWDAAFKDFPMVRPDGTGMPLNEWTRIFNPEIMRRVMDEPRVFAGNYFSMMRRYSNEPQRFLFPYAQSMSAFWSLAMLALLLAGFAVHARGSAHRKVTWLILSCLFCSLLSTPILNQLKDRVYASSISMNSLFAAMALYNGFLIASLLYGKAFGSATWSLAHRSDIGESKGSCSPAAASIWFTAFPVMLIAAVMLGPLFIDRLRETKRLPKDYTRRWPHLPGTSVAVISPRNSAYARFDLDRDFRVQNPTEVSRDKWGDEYPGDTLFKGRFHLVLAMDLAKNGLYSNAYTLFIPDSLLRGVDLSEVDTLVVRQGSFSVNQYKMALTRVQEVLAISGQAAGKGSR